MIHKERINPATGLPMVGENDISGNPYGSNLFSINNTYLQNNEVYKDDKKNEDISNLEFAIFILSLILSMGLFYYILFK